MAGLARHGGGLVRPKKGTLRVENFDGQNHERRRAHTIESTSAYGAVAVAVVAVVVL